MKININNYVCVKLMDEDIRIYNNRKREIIK